MKQGISRKEKKRRSKKGLAGLLAAVLLLTACGGKGETGEEKTLQDTGDYGYVVKETKNYSASTKNGIYPVCFQSAGGYLYYMNDGIYRIRIGEELDFAEREVVVSTDSLAEYNDYTLLNYIVDQEQNVYYCADNSSQTGFSVYKQTAEGKLAYHLFLEGEPADRYIRREQNMAADREGNVYVLSQTSLLRIDGKGNLTGKLSLEETLGGEPAFQNYLLRTSENRIFFFTNSTHANRRAYEVLEGNTPKLNPVHELDKEMDVGGAYLCQGVDGCLLNAEEDGFLYQYDPDTDTTETLLRWEDWDIYDGNVDEIVPVSEGSFFLILSKKSTTGEKEAVLLNRVAAEELPQKERIVLASLYPSEDMKAAVVDFNCISDRYHVTIESYGCNREDGHDAALVRLDGSMTTKDTPDLLDLSADTWSDLDLYSKYAGSGALEDLSPYMGKKSGIRKEDYLSNVLEGYTVGGKLLCIPQSFQVRMVRNTDQRVTEAGDWSMESLMEISGKYPEATLFPARIQSAVMLFGVFYGDYYLEKFVDWEAGTCSFDSEEFAGLLQWVKDQISRDTQDSLLELTNLIRYQDWCQFITEYDEGIQMYGFPSADGTPSAYIEATNMIGMAAKSSHKEGAWAFLQYYYLNGTTIELNGIPTRVDRLKEAEQEAMEPNYVRTLDGEIYYDDNGECDMIPRYYFFQADGGTIEFYFLEQEDADRMWELLCALDFTPRSVAENAIVKIVEEEAEAFLKGSKTAQETAKIIQGRVQIVVQENR